MADKVGQRAPVKRIGLYAGAGSRDYALMGGINASPKRGPDGSMADDGAAGAGSYKDQGDAFPQTATAFPTDSQDPQP